MVALASSKPDLLSECLALYHALPPAERRRVDQLCEGFVKTNGRKDPRQFPTFSFLQLLVDTSGMGLEVNNQWLSLVGPHDLGFTRPQAFAPENCGIEDSEFMAQSLVAHPDVERLVMKKLDRSESAVASWRKFAKSPPVEILNALVDTGFLGQSLSDAPSPELKTLQTMLVRRAPTLDQYLHYRRCLLSLLRPTPLRTKAAHSRLHRTGSENGRLSWPAFKLVVPAQLVLSYRAEVYLEDFISHLSGSFHCVWSDHDIRIRYPFANGGDAITLQNGNCTAILVGKYAGLNELGKVKIGELIDSYRGQHRIQFPTYIMGRPLPVSISNLASIQDIYPPVLGWNLDISRPYTGEQVFGRIPADQKFLERIAASIARQFSVSSRTPTGSTTPPVIDVRRGHSTSTTTSAY